MRFGRNRFILDSIIKQSTYYTNAPLLGCPWHEAPWDQQYVIHYGVGFTQILPGNRWIRIMKYVYFCSLSCCTFIRNKKLEFDWILKPWTAQIFCVLLDGAQSGLFLGSRFHRSYYCCKEKQANGRMIISPIRFHTDSPFKSKSRNRHNLYPSMIHICENIENFLSFIREPRSNTGENVRQ